MSFNFYFVINIAIFCAITLIVVTISTIMLKKQDDEFGIASIMGIISWFVAMIAYLFVGDPSMNEPTSAKTFGLIAGGIANFLFILPAIANIFKSIPKTINRLKEDRVARKEARKTKVTIEIKKKANIFDL